MVQQFDCLAAQSRLTSTIFACIALRGEDDPSINDLLDEYRQSVETLTAQNGPTAHCRLVDTLTWELYCAEMRKAGLSVPKFVSREEARAFLHSTPALN